MENIVDAKYIYIWKMGSQLPHQPFVMRENRGGKPQHNQKNRGVPMFRSVKYTNGSWADGFDRTEIRRSTYFFLKYNLTSCIEDGDRFFSEQNLRDVVSPGLETLKNAPEVVCESHTHSEDDRFFIEQNLRDVGGLEPETLKSAPEEQCEMHTEQEKFAKAIKKKKIANVMLEMVFDEKRRKTRHIQSVRARWKYIHNFDFDDEIQTEGLEFPDVEKYVDELSKHYKADINKTTYVKVVGGFIAFIYQLLRARNFGDYTAAVFQWLNPYLEFFPTLISDLMDLTRVFYNEYFTRVQSEAEEVNDSNEDFHFFKYINQALSCQVITAFRNAILCIAGITVCPQYFKDIVVTFFGPATTFSVVGLLKTLSESFDQLSFYFHAWLEGAPLSSILTDPDPYSSTVSKINALLVYDGKLYTGVPVVGLKDVRQFASEAVKLLDVAKILLPRCTKSGWIGKALNNAYVSLQGAYVRACSQIGDKHRQGPTTLVIVGPPGLGKSKIVMHSLRTHSVVKCREWSNDYTYTRVKTSPFWEGYIPAANPYVLYPEMGCESEDQIRKNGSITLMELTNLCEDQPFPCDMAFGQKGSVFANPEVVVIDTNNIDMHLGLLVMNPAAFFRRMVFVECCVKPQYRKGDTSQLDYEKSFADTETDLLDRWLFTVHIRIAKDNKQYDTVYLLKGGDIYQYTALLTKIYTENLEKNRKIKQLLQSDYDMSPYMPKSYKPDLRNVIERMEELRRPDEPTDSQKRELDKWTKFIGEVSHNVTQGKFPDDSDSSDDDGPISRAYEKYPSDHDDEKIAIVDTEHELDHNGLYFSSNSEDEEIEELIMKDNLPVRAEMDGGNPLPHLNLADAIRLNVLMEDPAQNHMDIIRMVVPPGAIHQPDPQELLAFEELPPLEMITDLYTFWLLCKQSYTNAFICLINIFIMLLNYFVIPLSIIWIYSRWSYNNISLDTFSDVRKRIRNSLSDYVYRTRMRLEVFVLNHHEKISILKLLVLCIAWAATLLLTFTTRKLFRVPLLLLACYIVWSIFGGFILALFVNALVLLILTETLSTYTITVANRYFRSKMRDNWNLTLMHLGVNDTIAHTPLSENWMWESIDTRLKILAGVCTSLGGAYALYSVYSAIVKKDVKKKPEIITEAHVADYERRLGCVPVPSRVKVENTNVWNTVSPPLTTQQMLSPLEVLVTKIGKNLREAYIKVGNKSHRTKILGLYGNIVLVNTHCLRIDGVVQDTFECLVAPPHMSVHDALSLKKTIVTRHRQVLQDVTLFEINDYKFFDIRPFISDKMVTTNIGYTFNGIRTNIAQVDSIVTNADAYPLKFDNVYCYDWITHGKGDCGTPLIAPVGKGYAIVGIHVAGREGVPACWATPLLRDKLDFPTTGFPICSEGMLVTGTVEPGPKSPFRYEPFHNLTFMGQLPGPVTLPQKSEVKKNHLSKTYCEILDEEIEDEDGYDKFGPPIMKPITTIHGYLSPYNLALRNINCDRGVLDDRLCEATIKDIYDRIAPHFKNASPLTFEEALNGASQDPYLRSMNFSTSPGFGLKGKKRDHIVEIDGKKVLKKHLEDEVFRIMECYLKGETSGCIYTAALKDEVRAKAKIDAGDTRVFFVGPMAQLLVARMMLAPLFTLMQEKMEIFCSAIGANMYTYGDKMSKSLLAWSKKFIELDYKKYDNKMPFGVKKYVHGMIYNLCKQAGYNEDALKILSGVLTEMTYIIVAMMKQLFEICGLTPSGLYGTAELNTLYGLFILVYCWKVVCPKKDFWSFVLPFIYGDDVTGGVKQEVVNIYNNVVIMNIVKEHFGMECTPSDKGAVMRPFLSFDEISFLKRSFVYRADFDRYVAPISRTSLLKSGCFYIPSKSVDEYTRDVDSVTSFLHEWYLHVNKDTWNNDRNKLCVSLAEHFGVPLQVVEKKLPSYDKISAAIFQ